jgi:hypothetical protein
MKEEIMNGVRGLSRAAESNTEESREKAQNAQEKSRFSIGIALFRGHSVIVNSTGQLVSGWSNQSNWVKVNQTELPGQASGRNRMEVPDNEQLAK